jgi:hypothetical protein
MRRACQIQKRGKYAQHSRKRLPIWIPAQRLIIFAIDTFLAAEELAQR